MIGTRAKGVSGEREVSRILSRWGIAHERYGYAAQRYDGAKADILVRDVAAIEVKRRRRGRSCHAAWLAQAEAAGRKYRVAGVVAYRFDRGAWRAAWRTEDGVQDATLDEWITQTFGALGGLDASGEISF